MEKVSIKKWDEDRFKHVLDEALTQYPTGREIDLDEVVAYHHSIPVHKNLPEMLAKARREGKTLLNPRAGVADLNEMIDILSDLQEIGKADILPINPDSFTRTEQFEKAAKGLEESIEKGHSMLNGFPVVAHGIKGCRKLFESVDRPVATRTATPRSKILCTMTIAGGATELLVGTLSLGLCMEYDVSPEASAAHAQFVARLVGWLHERGVKINLETVTTASAATLTTPSLHIVTGIVDSLISAYQGAKYLSVAFAPMHHFIQDIAGLRMQRLLTRRYLDRFGFHDVSLAQNIHQWNGAFPENKQQANGLLAMASAVAALYGEAEQMMVKTADEGYGIPTKESNIEGLIITRQVMNMLRGQRFPDSDEVNEESKFIEMEVESMIEKMLEMGEGDILVGVIKALRLGTYEYAYGVSKYCLGKVKLLRDATGAVRYLDIGNLPFSNKIVTYNKEKISERKKLEQRDELLMLIDDIREVRAFLS